jgi:hypothetical protein
LLWSAGLERSGSWVRPPELRCSALGRSNNTISRRRAEATTSPEKRGDLSEATQAEITKNFGEVLIWESSNLLLLISVVIGLVVLMHWLQGKAVFTVRDWLLLFGHPRDKVLTPAMAHVISILRSAKLRPVSSDS